MKLSFLAARLSLRAKLLCLNAVVVAALLMLSLEAWHASSTQERAQSHQVALAEAMQFNKQADMLHDALRADVLGALLIGQVPGLNHADSLTQVQANARALTEALGGLARVSLPADLAERLTHNRQAAEAYGAMALNIVHATGAERSTAMAALPEFEARFSALLKDLAAQGERLTELLKEAQARSASESSAARQTLLWACGLTIVLASLLVAAITHTIRRRLSGLSRVAQAIAGGALEQRVGGSSDDELGQLGQAIDRMASGLAEMIGTMRAEAERAEFGKQLSEALDMADHERQVAEVAARAMADISPEHAMELLVSDSSRAQMERAAEHPNAGAPGCAVGSPYDCVAVRRGTVVSFAHSEALNACAQLRGRSCGPVAATCVPVTFMGRAIGVLHAAGAPGRPLASGQAQQLATTALQIGMRIGTVRAFEKTQIQASTDGLTGLPNRRTVEQRLREACRGSAPFAVVMCDLDRFKLLNDTHGHSAGDAALRIFSEVLRQTMREGDIAGRWGGEEFTFVLARADAEAAALMVQRLRAQLAAALRLGKGPVFTASFGISDSGMARRPEALVQLADLALYQAKGAGRDRACIAEPALAEAPPVRHAELPAAANGKSATALRSAAAQAEEAEDAQCAEAAKEATTA